MHARTHSSFAAFLSPAITYLPTYIHTHAQVSLADYPIGSPWRPLHERHEILTRVNNMVCTRVRAYVCTHTCACAGAFVHAPRSHAAMQLMRPCLPCVRCRATPRPAVWPTWLLTCAEWRGGSSQVGHVNDVASYVYIMHDTTSSSSLMWYHATAAPPTALPACSAHRARCAAQHCPQCPGTLRCSGRARHARGPAVAEGFTSQDPFEHLNTPPSNACRLCGQPAVRL